MTKIEWTHRPGTKGESWNMIAGCTKVQPECQNCYALRDSWRIMHNPRHPARYDGVAEMVDGELQWTGRVNVDWDALEQPRHWTKPRTVFVASMADLFHTFVPNKFIDAVFNVIEDTSRHTYLVLTKRSERMVRYCRNWQWPGNCWAGVSAGTQLWLARHVANLAQLQGPPIKFVSAEPLLEPVGLFDVDGDVAVQMETLNPRELRYPADVIDWLLIGGESGKRAREMQLGWPRELLRDCRELGIPAFVKQLGAVYAREQDLHHCSAADPREWPDDLRVREWPL